MATSRPPSTPGTQTSQASIVTPSPGSWRHPKFDEIARRQDASTFSGKNVRRILWNAGFLLFTFSFPTIFAFFASFFSLVPPTISKYANITVYLLRAVFLYNIFVASLPLVRGTDNLVDIPLTPSQRALLGLDPNATPPMTPGTQYITPPRYPRSSTPRSGTPGSRSSSTANSPLSRNDSPSFGKQASESPFTPSASPLWQKAVGGARDPGRRHSYGSPSPLGPGVSGKEMSVLGAPNTPSPSTGRGASVALNSRWLYERGRGSPGSRGL